MIFTVLTIFLSIAISSYQIGENRRFQVNQSVNVSEEFEANVVVARESSTKIMKAFQENDKKYRTNTGKFRYTLSGISADGFPDYYAGKYINVDGNLVVLLTDEYSDNFIFASTKSKEARAELAEISGQKDIIYGSAKYSMKELLNAMEQIYTFVVSDKATEENVKITTFDMYENKDIIEVGLYPFNEEAIKWFRANVADKDFIVFYEREHSGVEATASIRPGGRIKLD